MTPKEVVQKYYDNLAQKNETWNTLFADDITFSDSAMNMNEAGKDAVTNSFNRFLKGVEDLRVKLMITENETVCAVVSVEGIIHFVHKYIKPVQVILKATKKQR